MDWLNEQNANEQAVDDDGYDSGYVSETEDEVCGLEYSTSESGGQAADPEDQDEHDPSFLGGEGKDANMAPDNQEAIQDVFRTI